MNRRSILAAYKKKSSHFQTGVTGFKSGNLFNIEQYGLPHCHPSAVVLLVPAVSSLSAYEPA